MNTLHDLYVDQLLDLRDAENQLIRVLPRMVQSASDPHLKKAFADHLEQTQEHARRLTEILGRHAASGDETCEAMEGLLREGDEILGEPNSALKDVALIAAAQRVEHYEIAGYGTVVAYAKELGEREDARILKQTLDEEASADNKLTKIAMGGVLTQGLNQKAA